MNLDQIIQKTQSFPRSIAEDFGGSDLYLQIGLVSAVLFIAWALASYIKKRVEGFSVPERNHRLSKAQTTIKNLQRLLMPLFSVIGLSIFGSIGPALLPKSWLIQGAQGLTLIWLVFSLVSHFVRAPGIIFLLKWIGIPLGLLQIAGLLAPFTQWLDGFALQIGNIKLTLYTVLRTLIFGFLLFWLGRWSNQTGQKVIRTRPNFDSATREVVSKLFEIAIFVIVFLLLLNVMGIDLTALAVFGGALGVGLGFGLQQIASNFISGIIILLDRSISIGDYIQLEDGRSGRLRELSMRSATLETFDGKDIMVPNEKFITTSFTNWTHNNERQRYPLKFQVSYDTDLDLLFQVVRDVVASHPQVMSGDDLPIELRPDAEIDNFGESGINILVEFWMEGIDDGENRVGADLQYMIWGALRQHNIKIPFPRRDIRVVDPSGAMASNGPKSGS